MSFLTLSFTLLFILVTMIVSAKKKLGLEKDIWIGTIRAAIQLLAVGYILDFVFKAEQWYYYILIILMMSLIAAKHGAKRANLYRGAYWKVWLTIVIIEAFVMLILLGLNIIEAKAQFIIPISGMTIGNAMVVSGLFLTALHREKEVSKAEIEMLLSLGANEKQALQRLMSRSVKFSMIPTLDALKTVGLVQLPGMMTGMIIAGASPVEAVKYQLLILFTHAGAAALASILLSVFFHRAVLTKDLRVC